MNLTLGKSFQFDFIRFTKDDQKGTMQLLVAQQSG